MEMPYALSTVYYRDDGEARQAEFVCAVSSVCGFAASWKFGSGYRSGSARFGEIMHVWLRD
jgi:hypothetical protein